MTPKSFRLNTAINLIGSGLMLLYSLLLPGILSRALTTEGYGAYSLGIQFVQFLMLLAIPIQQSLTPHFARLNADGDTSGSVDLFRTSISLLAVMALVAVIVTIVASKLLPFIFGWKPEFSVIASKSIKILGIAAALSFPVFSVVSFTSGRQDFILENIYKCSGPFSGLALVAIWMSLSSKIDVQLMPLHVIYLFATATVVAALLIVFWGSRFIPIKGLTFGKLNPAGVFLHLREARGVLWWQLCALLSVPFAPFIVSSVESAKVAGFVVSLSLMNVIAGLSSVIAGPLAVKIGQSVVSDVASRTYTFLKIQRLFCAYLFCSTSFLLMMPTYFFELWVGTALAVQISTLIVPLALANMLRQMTGPYTAAILGLGLQNKLWLSPAVEAIGSVVFGALFGTYFGATGVAYGILVGASLRIIITILHDIASTRPALNLSTMDLVLPFHINIYKFFK
jgi:O-antigen/teichoic acid export membrane protein